eukprot:1130996-Pleurochrysis_carterae.AAC.1
MSLLTGLSPNASVQTVVIGVYLRHGRFKLLPIQPLEGRARSDTVARTESFKPRTPQLTCTSYLETLPGSTSNDDPDQAGNHALKKTCRVTRHVTREILVIQNGTVYRFLELQAKQ